MDASAGAAAAGHDQEKARLDALLKNRPDAKELQDKNILKGGGAGSGTGGSSSTGVAPALQAAQASLLKHQLEDKLEKSLEGRRDKAELERLGILKDTNVAPGLQARQEELKRAQLEDKLEGSIESRPKREDLEQRGILPKGADE